MAALPTTGKISFLDIFNNINSNTVNPNSPFSIQDASEQMASASVVKDLDESGAMDVADRNLLYNKPYDMTEFYEANFPSSIITGITLSTNQITGDPVSVDGEDVTITFTTDGTAGTYTVRLKDTSGDTDGSTTRSGAGAVTFSSLALDADTYRPQVEFDTFNIVNDDSTFQHFDAVGSGDTDLSYTSTNVNAADEAVASLTITPTVGSGIQISYTVAETVLEGGDGDDIDTNVSSNALTNPTTVTVSNTPGKIRFTTTHRGGGGNHFVTGLPRNSTTSNDTLDIRYNNAIDSITQTQGNVNVYAVDGAGNATFTCYSEGYSGTLTIGYDDSATATDKDLLGSATEPVTTYYQRETINKSLNISSAGTYYPKAYHDGNAVVGSSFIVAPQLAFSTTGNDSISVGDTSHAFKATSPVGRNFSMTISANSAGSPSTTDYATGFTISPGTVDGQYTITYNASADFSQTGPDQTDILYVYPAANYTINSGDTTLLINSPAGAGLTDDNLQLNATTSVGDNISAYLYTVTKDTAFLDSSLNKTYTDAITTIAASTLESAWGPGQYNTSLRVTGANGLQNTQTDGDSFTIANHPPQALTVTAPNGNILRRGSAFSILWSKTSAVYVNLKLYRDVLGGGSYSFDSNIDVAGNNTGTSYSWTVPGDATLVNDRYKVYGYVYNGTATDYSPIFSIRDGIALAPSTPSDSSGNEEALISWTDGSYNVGGNKVYTYEDSGGSSQTAVSSTIAGTSYTYSESRTSTTVTRYFKVSGINLSGEEGSKSGVSGGANIYPILSEEFQASDISFGTSPVEVGQTTVLQIANVADNIVGYTWSHSGGGSWTVTAGSYTAGDVNGTSDDGTGLIDESNITVRFDSAVQNKTISLALYGRNDQSVTRTKNIDVELADALTINAIGHTNSPNSITVSGNQSGFAGGVTVGFATNASNASFVASTEETTNPDSRFTLRSYSESFTPSAILTTQYLVGRVEVDGESDALNTSAFYYYPALAGRNDIVCSGTVYSTAGSNSTGITKTVSVTDTTDNVTSYTYSVQSGGGSISSGATGGSTINNATYTAGGSIGSVILRLAVNGNSGQYAQDETTPGELTTIYYPKLTSTNTNAGTGTGTNYNDINFYVYWQGFTLSTGADWITFKLYDDDNNLEGTVTKYGTDSHFVVDGSTTTTGEYYRGSFGSLNANYSITTADNYYFRVEAFDGGVSKGSIDTSQFTINVPSLININCELASGTLYGGFTTLLNAADETATSFVAGTTPVWYTGGSITNSTDFFTNNTLGTRFDGDPPNNDSNIFYSYAGYCFEITDGGDVAQVRSRIPETLENPTSAANGTDDIYLSIPGSSNNIVTRNIRVRSNTSIGGNTTRTFSVGQSTSYSASNISMKSLFGASLASGQSYTFDIRGENGYTSGAYGNTTSATTVSNTITSISASPTSWEYGAATNVTISYTKNFTDTLTIAMFNGGTTYQTKTNVGSGTGAKTQTFTKNWVTAVGASNFLDFKFSYYSSGTLIHTESNLAKAVEVTTPGSIGEVVATDGTSTLYCLVSWTSAANVNAGYDIYRSGTAGGTYSLLDHETATPHYDTTGTAGTTYFYKVLAKRTMTAYTGGSSAVPRTVDGPLSGYDYGWKGTGGCWSLDSMVTMADDTLVRLDDIQVGDVVKSFAYQDMIDESEGPHYTSYTNNTLTDGYFTTSTVISKTLKTLSSYYIINDNIKVSSMHPLWVFSNDTWKWDYTPNISIGCKLVNTNKEEVNVDSIEQIPETLEAGWINVEDVDTCFIQNVLVHNDK